MKNKKSKIVWEFTNQKKLNKNEFLDYFERKIFRTIRKFNMLPEDKVIRIKTEKSLNYNVLKNVLERKFKVISGDDFVLLNLSEIAEKIFGKILEGNFNFPDLNCRKLKAPLYYLSDDEIELYARLRGIKGRKRKKNRKIRDLFEKFIKKNPDLEHNIINAVQESH